MTILGVVECLFKNSLRIVGYNKKNLVTQMKVFERLFKNFAQVTIGLCMWGTCVSTLDGDSTH